MADFLLRYPDPETTPKAERYEGMLCPAVERSCLGYEGTGGVNNSVQVAKRPISPTASAGRSAVTSCLIDEYTTKNNY